MPDEGWAMTQKEGRGADLIRLDDRMIKRRKRWFGETFRCGNRWMLIGQPRISQSTQRMCSEWQGKS